MELNLPPPTPMETSLKLDSLLSTSMEVYIEVGGYFHGSGSNGSRWTIVEVAWKQLEGYDSYESIWKGVKVYGSS